MIYQVHTLLKGLEKIAASADIPMLVAGDFNSLPGRLVVVFWPCLDILSLEIVKMSTQLYLVQIMCGLHGSAPHSLLEKGHVDANHPDLQVDPLNILRPASKLLHTLPLVSIFVAIYLYS